MTLLRVTERGLYCEAGDFYVDPWASVDRAVVTHAHGDHVAWGCRAYLTSAPGLGVLRQRLDPAARIRAAAYGEPVDRQRRPRLAPSGGAHSRLRPGTRRARGRGVGRLGRLQDRARSHLHAVRAGPVPYLRHRIHLRPPDLSLAGPARGVRGDPRVVAGQPGRRQGHAALRLRAGQGAAADRGTRSRHRPHPHSRRRGAHERRLPGRRRSAPADHARRGAPIARTWKRAIVIAPPSADGSTWARRFGAQSTAFASGWMAVRGTAAAARGRPRLRPLRSRGLARPARRHRCHRRRACAGSRTATLASWSAGCASSGLDAQAVETRYEGERDDAADSADEARTAR